MLKVIYFSKLFMLCVILILAGGLINDLGVAYIYKVLIGYIAACFGVVALGFVSDLHNEVIGGE